MLNKSHEARGFISRRTLFAMVFLLLANQLILLQLTHSYNDVKPHIISSLFTKKTPTNRIAIITSFVPGRQSSTNRTNDLDHLINKACYAKLWGYDFIFNTTFGFDRVKDIDQGGAWWLEYGTWHRVPHIRDRIKDYDWILYADVDYVFVDMKRSLESFFKEWELFDKQPSILVPRDFGGNEFTFSAFAVFVKNDPFGIALLDHWMRFARGLCERGNLSHKKRDYTWLDSDQPGLWYALTRAHSDFFPHTKIVRECNISTGLVDTAYAYMDGLDDYFKSVGIQLGSEGSVLKTIPADQPILWSTPGQYSSGGLGVQLNWGVDDARAEMLKRNAFAIHEKNVSKWPQYAQATLEMCKTIHGCYANYTNEGLDIGCMD